MQPAVPGVAAHSGTVSLLQVEAVEPVSCASGRGRGSQDLWVERKNESAVRARL